MSTLSNDHRAAAGAVHRAALQGAAPAAGRLRHALAGLRAAVATRRPVPSAVGALAGELVQALAAAFPARAVAVARLHQGVRAPPAARLLAVSAAADLKATELFLADVEGGLAAPPGPSGLPTLAARDGILVIATAAARDEDGVALVLIDAAGEAARDPALAADLRGIAVAIDDHLRACDAIAASDQQRLLEEAIDGLGDGFVAYDSRMRLVAHNQRYTEYFPYFRALGSLRGRSLRDLAAYNVSIGRWTPERADEMFRGLIRGTLLDAGRIAVVDQRKVMMRDFRTASGGLVGLRTDVTRLVEREEELRQALGAAEAASRDKTAFLAQMSHELRTPLNAIIGFSEMMAAEMFGPLGAEKYRAYAEDIRTSAGHLLALINDLLDMSRIERGNFALDLGTLDLAEVVDGAVRMLKPTAERAQLTLALAAAPEPLPVTGDRRATMQIVVNLLSNAIKFTPAGGTVIVTTARGPEGASVEVADTGMGMKPGDLERLGRPFERGEDAVRLGLPGTGLGLAISMALARLQGGTLAIDSAEGKGTRATLTLSAEQATS
jgi:two-component system cell cycle sensor histidine kinase PleC